MSDFKVFLEEKKLLLTKEIIDDIETNYPKVLEIFKRKQFEIEQALTLDKKKELLLFLERGIENLQKDLFTYYSQPNFKYIYNGYDGTLINVYFYFLYKDEYERLKEEILNFSEPILSNELIDYSDSSLKEKIIVLKELGIIEYLQEEFTICQTSTNKLSEVISLIIGEKSSTIQSYINPMINSGTSQKNNPYINYNSVEKSLNRLNNLGIKKSK